MRLTFRRLLPLLLLTCATSVFAGPTVFTPTVEQCDGSYTTGSTRVAQPHVRVGLQNSTSPGLKVNTQPSDFFSGQRLGLRFEDNYRIDVSSCITVSNKCPDNGACGSETGCADSSTCDDGTGICGTPGVCDGSWPSCNVACGGPCFGNAACVDTTQVPADCGSTTSCAIAKYRYADTSSVNSADHGLLGTYYTINDDVVNPPGQPNFDWKVRVQEVDAQVNFTNGATWPPGGLASTPTYAARWTGFVTPPTSGNYSFTLDADDGVELYVNGVNIISSWQNQAVTIGPTAGVPMTAGQPYEIVLEYYQGPGSATIRLKWQSDNPGSSGSCSATGSAALIPQACLTPQLVGQIGECVYTGADCSSLSLNGTQSHTPLPSACPAYASLPVAPPAGPTPWATVVPGGAPSNPAFWGTNHAFNFDGSSKFISYSNQGQFYLPTSFTMSAWVKTPDCTGVERILSQQDSGAGSNFHYWLFRINNCKIDFEDSREGPTLFAPGRQGTVSIPNDGGWHFLAASRQNGTSWRYYVDGRVAFTGSAISTTTLQIDSQQTSVPPISPIVGSLSGTSEFFNGQIDELRLYAGTPLSDDTILGEYAANAYKYSTNGGSSFSISTVGYTGAVANGDTGIDTLAPSTAAASSVFVFIAQSADGLSTVESPSFTVNVDQTAPAPPTITATPLATNQIRWDFNDTRICADGLHQSYELHEASTPIVIANTAPGSAATYTETLADTSPNVSHARYAKASDVWPASPSALGPITTAYTLAAAPTGLTKTAATATTLSLTWSTNGNPTYTRYILAESPDGFVTGPSISTPIPLSANFTGNTFQLTGLTAGSPYYFRVYAVNGKAIDTFGGILTAFSSFATFTTPSGSPISGIPISNTQVDWHWKDVQGATSYNLYSAGAAAPFASVPSPGSPGADVSYSSTGLLTNNLYSAQLQPVNSGGTGDLSPAGNAYTFALKPTAMLATGVSTNSASFQWDAGAAPPLADPSYTFYEVSVATDPLFAVVVATQTTQQLTMSIGGLLPASTYYARVRAYSGGQVPTGFTVSLATVTNTSPDVTLSSGPPSVYAPPLGAVGLWQFDEGTSTKAKDSSGYGNDGVLECLISACVSTPTWISGPPNLNYAVNPSGQVSSLIMVADPGTYAFTGALSVAAWVKPSTTAQPNGAAIVAKGTQGAEAFSLDLFGGRYRFLLKQPGSLSVTAPTLADTLNWHRVVGTYDGVNANLYIDGSLVAGPVAIGGPRAAPLCGGVNCPVVIGNRVSGTGSYDLGFSGGIDSAMIVDRALSASEVASDYAGAFASTMTLPAPNNRLQLILPPNAFGAPTVIYASNDPIAHPIKIDNLTMTQGLLNEPTGQALIGGSLVEIVPTVGGLPYTLPLGSSATIALPYNDSGDTGLVDGSNPKISVETLTVYTLDPTVIKWNALPSVVDRTNHVVRATTPHFSVFALFGATTIGTALDQVRVYPKPWIIGSKGRFDAPSLTFDTLPARGKIKIFNLAGERVVELPFDSNDAGKITWGGTNVNGLPVASGVYFAYIKNEDNQATSVVKFAIER